MDKVVIIGAGGLGREILEILKAINCTKKRYNIIGFIDDDITKRNKLINGYRVIGSISWLIKNKKDIKCVCAIGDPKQRKRICSVLELNNIKFINAIHPSVILSDYIKLGHDVIICAGCILTVNITIGNHVIINLNSTVGHDSIIEQYCSIMPGVIINGRNHIHEGAYIGSGVTFIQDIKVGSNSIIGAGAVLTNNIPNNVTAVGIPAKPIQVR